MSIFVRECFPGNYPLQHECELWTNLFDYVLYTLTYPTKAFNILHSNF